MSTRQDLQDLLVELLGTEYVYFQPPSTLSMSYPCIVYKRERYSTSFANNRLYRNKTRWQITVIDRNPDSAIPDKVRELPLCSFDRFYTADNLNHDVFNLYF